MTAYVLDGLFDFFFGWYLGKNAYLKKFGFWNKKCVSKCDCALLNIRKYVLCISAVCGKIARLISLNSLPLVRCGATAFSLFSGNKFVQFGFKMFGISKIRYKSEIVLF